MKLRDSTHAHLYDKSVGVPHRRFGIVRAAEHLIERLHLRQPLRIGGRYRKLRSGVAAFGDATGAFRLGLALGLLPVGMLEHCIERAFPDAAAGGGNIMEPLDLVRVEVGSEHNTNECRRRLFLRALGQRRFGSARIKPQLVNCPPVGEAVYPRRPIRAAHDARLGPAVLDAFERIGEGYAFENGRGLP